MKYINVALPIKINSLFLYSIEEDIDLTEITGRRVLVNFNGKNIRGYAVSEGSFTNDFKIKPIKKIIDNRKIFTDDMVNFANWIADYYFAGIGEVLSLMIPKGVKPAENITGNHKNIISNKLSNIQQVIYDNIINDINNNIKKFYLYGITGSGKTEIYIKLIEYTLKQNKNIIFLVPEIAISYQTLEYLKKIFGTKCAILHSNLKGSIRLREYIRLLDNEAKIVIGTRSALFAPISNLGLIIIDEENDHSYKSEENPRFHARTAAQYLALKNDSIIILGSATPSIESWYYTKKNYFKLYLLKERYGGAELPDVEIVDNSTLITKKNISPQLASEINNRLKNNEQVVLLQNRRGFSNFIKCTDCSYIISCPRCNISLTYHKSKNKLICHHCGYKINYPDKCTKCNCEKLIKIGAGTERIEDEIAKMFSHAVIERMDRDSLKNENDYKHILKKMEKGEIDILIGTQMIAKGLHFPKIKFVGIINADLILNIPDFKASERAFSLITQVSGRAGREGKKGHVMIQTYNPDHYSITTAKNNDYETFYKKEIEYRQLMKMPPFKRLIRLVIRGVEEKRVINDINNIYNLLNNKQTKNIEILGPAPCLFTKINYNYRYQILLKSDKITSMQKLVKENIKYFTVHYKNYLEIDIDPVNLL